MRELLGHRVELPSSPCVAGNTSGVKRRRRDGARASEGTASRPRDAAGSDSARVAVGPSIHLLARASASACLTTCRATLQLSQLTKPAHPRVPQSDRRMQRLRGEQLRSFARKVHHVVCAHNTMLAELVQLDPRPSVRRIGHHTEFPATGERQRRLDARPRHHKFGGELVGFAAPGRTAGA